MVVWFRETGKLANYRTISPLGCPLSNVSKVIATDSSGDDGGGSDSNDGPSNSSSPNKDEDTIDGGGQGDRDNDDGTQTGSSDNGNNLPDDSNSPLPAENIGTDQQIQSLSGEHFDENTNLCV